MNYVKTILGVVVVLCLISASGLVLAQEKQKKRLPEKMSIALDGGVKMDFVLIHPGSFMMGSEKGYEYEKPVHKVRITKPFYMGIYEVTQAQWKAVMGENPSHFKGDELPVESVSWEDCQRFISKVKVKAGEGWICRLPTEAEWEYACCAGAKTQYCFGDEEGALGEYAWYVSNSDSKTQPVGQKKPNAWGLYDMHGNVSEWCQDWYDFWYYRNGAGDDPQGPSPGNLRVLRGGSWNEPACNCRASRRFDNAPSLRLSYYGFRVVCGLAVGR